MKAKLDFKRGKIIVSFPFDKELVEKVKALSRAHYVNKPFDPETKTWKLTTRALAEVLALFPEADKTESFKEVETAMTFLEQKQRELDTRLAKSLKDIAEPLTNGETLYQHQQVAVVWMLERKKVILADDMGLGKTRVALVAAKKIRDVTQLPTHVICPAHLTRNWMAESKMVEMPVIIHSWAKIPEEPQHCILIVDECFVAGTLVDTAQGPRPIEEIKPGDCVYSARGLCRVKRVGSRTAKAIVEVLTDSGKKFQCTPEHLFLTQCGWVQACQLRRTHYIQSTHEAMRLLRDGVQAGEDDRSLLLQVLRDEIEVEKRALQSDGARHFPKDESGARARPSLGNDVFAAHEASESHVGKVCSAARERHLESHQAQTKDSRGQRDRRYKGGGSFLETVSSRRVELRGGDEPERIRLPVTLQDRRSFPRVEIGCRDRRRIALWFVSAGAGQEENGIPAGERVDRVALQKRSGAGTPGGSEGGCRVFNLEVEGHPSYSVNECLVHNCHYGQSMKSKRTKRMLEWASEAMAVFLLSGTPMKNGIPINLFPLLRAVEHPLGLNRNYFEQHFCGATLKPVRVKGRTIQVWDTSGAQNLDELRQAVRGTILRRKKDQCLDMPEKTRVLRDVEVKEDMRSMFDKRFKEMKDGYLLRVERNEIASEGESLAMLTFIRQAASLAKVDSAIELIDEALEQQGQVIVFSSFVETVNRIAAHYATAGYSGEPESPCRAYTGEVSQSERHEIWKAFQAGKQRVFPATFGAGGTGLNLTAANTVVLLDRPMTPADAEQAEDRAHRIGQKWPVTVYWLRAFPVDEVIDSMLYSKMGRISEVLDGQSKDQESHVVKAVSVLHDLFIDE